MTGKRKSKKWIMWVVVILVIAVLAVFAIPNIISVLQGGNRNDRSTGSDNMGAMGSRSAASSDTGTMSRGSYETAERGELKVTVYGSGSLSPQRKYSIFNDSEGKIESIEVEAGDTVSEGDVLARLSSSDIETNIKTYEKELFDAQVALSGVRDSGSSYYVYAPSSGTLKQLMCAEDDDVASVMNQYGYLAVLSRDDKMRVKFEPENGAELAIGDKVNVWVNDTGVTGIVDQTVGLGNDIAVVIEDDDYEIGQEVMITTLQGEHMGSGTLEINMPVPITAIGGTIDTVYYEEGDSISSGYKLFYTTGRLPSAELQSALLTYEEARTALDNEKEKQNNLVVRAPMDGVITSVDVSQGARLEESTSLITMQSATEFKVVATVDELDVVNVREGQEVQVEIDAYPDETFTGVVQRISGVGTVSGGVATYEVTVVMNEDPRLKDGMTASIEIVVADKKDVVLVPVEAISTSGGQKYVTTSSGVSVPVTVGESNDEYAEILSGVEEGESVLITRSSSDDSSNTRQDRRDEMGGMGGMPGMGGGMPGMGGRG